jgi:monothiol bacilliredoxin
MRELTSLADLREALGGSAPLFILQHSPHCHYCLIAHQLMDDVAAAHPEVSVVWVNVLDHRDLSDTIAELTLIKHESPQLFLFRHGEMVWHANYPDIARDAIEEQVK